MDFLKLFKNKKPVIAMLHLKGDSDADVFERFKNEVDIYYNEGIDGVIVENYFGNFYNTQTALEYLQNKRFDLVYGVNCLNNDAMGFELANKYGAKFLQIDSVVGHVQPRDEATLDAFYKLYKKRINVCVIGGVRFKYQPVLSTKTLAQDLTIAKKRCEAICVTGEKTGSFTPMEKVISFRKYIRDFPLIVAAGVTAENLINYLDIADGVIIGSYFKDNYEDSGEVCVKHVNEIVTLANRWRGNNND